jgi:phage terminase large subunit-like protein
MVRNDPRLEKRLKIIDSQKRIVDLKTGSVYRAISAEAYSKHGFNASLIVYDELHAAPNRDLWDVLTTSQGARWEPLTVAITTAGYDRHSICWEIHDYAGKVRDGIVNDPSFLPVIYSAAEDADWTDEHVWRQANPALEDFRDIEEMRALAARAREVPAQQNTFRRLYLNQWTEQAQRWIDMAAWDRCGESAVDAEALKGTGCFAGLDLSTTTDLSACVLVFAQDAGMVVLPFFWCPEERIEKRARADRVPYDQWVKAGLLTQTPGNVVDYDQVRADINELGKQYRIHGIAFDPWNATQLAVQLQGDGFQMVETRQGFKTLNEPTKELSGLIVSGGLQHGGHAILRWMASNMVVRQDPAGNIAPDKAKATERIDGIVALIMALGRLIVQPEESGSIYESRGIATV